MLKKFAGYTLAIIGFLGYGFFKNYNGSVITNSTLWFIASIGIGIAGLFLITTSRSLRLSKQDKYNNELLAKLKKNGERILLTVENCEIKENNYYEEVTNSNFSKAQQIDALYDSNRNYQQKYIEQSAIIFYHLSNDKKHRMTSQTFPFNAKTLTNYIELKRLAVYISRFDKNIYAFELTN
ncbi:MAG: hypothetical protein ABIN67_10965 [Ferruginibacter sp.]